MFFELYTLLFHTKCVRDDLSILLNLKSLCKESRIAYKHTNSRIFANALLIRNITLRCIDPEDMSWLQSCYYRFTQESKRLYVVTLDILSEKLINYENFSPPSPCRYSLTMHMLKDPFYPAKGKTLPGQILRFRKTLENNRYLDSIINLASKPKKTITY